MASSERALGRYTLQEPIATGTTATIWRARDTRTGTLVAIKRFHPHLFADRVARKRMANEAAAALRVHAPTIVSAIDRISKRDEFALVFPFVAGTPLSERLREAPPLTADEVARIGADVADALAAIHSAGFVHRDVKPGNVLLGDDGRARLLDFGISRTVTDEIGLDQALTGAGLAIGTLPYMAPEQLTGDQAGSATDVFALGVVLYEMLSGVRPFVATTPVALSVEQRSLPARIAGAPEPLVDLAMRALAIDPVARPSAAQLASALREWRETPIASDAPTAAVATVAFAPASEPQPRRRLGALATAAVAVAGALLVALVALAAVTPLSVPNASGPSPAQVAAAQTVEPTTTPAPTAASTPAPVVPAVQPKASQQPTTPPAANTAPSPKPPSAAPHPPKHQAHHRHHHHHPHHRHHPKHHRRHHH